MKSFGQLYEMGSTLFFKHLRMGLKMLDIVSHLCALLFIVSLVYRYGFDATVSGLAFVHTVCQVAWVVFLMQTTMRILFRLNDDVQHNTVWSYFLYAFLYLTLLPLVFHKPDTSGFVHSIWYFFHHSYYKWAVVCLYALSVLSGGLVKLWGKRTNPSLILASSFFIIIVLGTILLMLPRSTVHGIHWLDALFLATSATCVTGLSTLDVSSVLTLEGQTLLLILIQIGGLGLMTFTSFFALFFMGNSSLYNQMVVRDMISSESLNSLLSTLLYILGFTLAIEGVGAVFIWGSIHGTLSMSFEQELFFAVFHSISAFCNAGFSTIPMGMSNPTVMQGHNFLYLVLSVLIILGGIGFPILVNFKSSIHYYLHYWWMRLFHRSRKFNRRVHLYNLNTKIVLWTTLSLLLAGTVLIAGLEWNHSLREMPWTDRWVQAFFNAVCPRTAGFSSVSFLSMTRQTLLFYMLMMVIGGGTQSTAGGVKINVFAVVLLNLYTVIRGKERVVVTNRELDTASIRRSNAVCLFYFVVLFTGLYAMTFTEPEVSLMKLAFECISAISTVGSSLDLTSHLSSWGKGIVIVMMFVGRVGGLTLLSSLIKPADKLKIRYPSDQIIIN